MHKNEPRWLITPSDKKLSIPFLKGTPIKILQNDNIQYEADTPQGKIKIITHLKDTYQISKGNIYEDMCEMNILNEPQVLRNLIQRYKKDEIFTYIGPTLVIVNPYKPIQRHFNNKILMQKRNAVISGNLKGSPHIYMIAGKAYQGILNNDGKQAIIISGESGAGKTQSTKYCMKMITSLSHKESHSIQNKILACNPLLQAFGNSKTIRNDNSSRFGKYVQIFFGKDHTIVGANIISYLLEKSRVVSIAQNQRTYHAFYALTSSKQYGVKDAKSYAYLKQSGTFTANNINDSQYFCEINSSMDEIGFSKSEKEKIWNLLIAILQLGNLQFNDKNHQNNQNIPCEIINGQQLHKITKALEINEKLLQQILLYQKKTILKEINFKPYSKLGCIGNRNTFSKAIYNTIFQFIIYKVQIALNSSIKNNENSINLLDIFGFQNFQQNSLQQLCINFTNQKLLKQYNRYVFQNEMVILREDDLQRQIQDIKPPTNDDVIALISSKVSLFSIINDNTTGAQFQDSDMINGFKKQYGKSKLLKYNLINKNLFTIIHSQCQVTYSIDGFKLKNQDKVNSEIQEIYKKLFVNENKNQSGKTLLLKFSKEIDDLVNELSTANNHFVRCIKPNEEKLPNKVVEDYLLTQVRYLGVFETIQIRQKTFPFRKLYSQFIHSFQQIFHKSKNKQQKQAIKIILKEVNAKDKDFLLGNKRIYMNKQLQDNLNKAVYKFMKIKIQKATKIQKQFKVFIFRKKIFTKLKLLVKRKNIWRKIQKTYRLKILKQAKNLIFQLSQFKKKKQQQIKMKKMLQKQDTQIKQKIENDKKKKEEELKKQQQLQKIIKQQQLKQKQKIVDNTNVSLKGMFSDKNITNLDQSIVVASDKNSYKRMVRPMQEVSKQPEEGAFNQSYIEGQSIYYSSNPGVLFQRNIQIEMFTGKGYGNLQKLQKILAQTYKLEINGNQQQFFSPNSHDCNFKIEETPIDLLNKILHFEAQQFFKKVLRKRTNFIGFSKSYQDVLVAKNRPMSKTLTLMQQLDEEKALKVFKVIVRIGEQSKLDNVFRLIQNMISLCQSTSQQLKNEVFLQLIKQCNTSSQLASIRIYQSLAVYLHIYIPDQDFIVAGLFIFYKKLQEIKKSSQKQEQYLRYLFKKMIRKIQNPPIIGYMPIKYQMMALMCKRQISIPVYLPVGNSILIRVESYDTFADIKQRVIKQFGIDYVRLKPQMFRFFEIVNFENEELQQSPLNENQIVWDIMTYWQLAKQKYKEANSPPPSFFLMLKIVYCFQVYPDDEQAIQLCFAQCYFDYFIGRIRLNFHQMAGLAACVKHIKLPNRPQTQILGSYPIWMVKKYDKQELSSAMIENLKQMKGQKLTIFEMKYRFLQICNECQLSMSMAIPTDQSIKLFLKPKKIFLAQKYEIKQQFTMRSIVKWAIDKEKFVFDVKGNASHAIFTQYASVCSQFLSDLPKVLKKTH